MRYLATCFALLGSVARSTDAFVVRRTHSIWPVTQDQGRVLQVPRQPDSSRGSLALSSANSGWDSAAASSSSSPLASPRGRGTFRSFADYAWKQLERQQGLETVELSTEFTSKMVPAKAPKDHFVRLTTKALRAKRADTSSHGDAPKTNPIRYARMVLLETIPSSAMAKNDAPTDEVTTNGVQVLNIVVFPHTDSNLPVWGADFVSLPGDKHLILLDAQPMTKDTFASASYDAMFRQWHKEHVTYTSNFGWGGDMPDGVRPFISEHALWTRFQNEEKPVEKIQGPLLQAFQEHLNLYLQLLQDNKDRFSSPQSNHQPEYVQYRLDNDPARPMLKSLFGEEYTEKILDQVLFPAIPGVARRPAPKKTEEVAQAPSSDGKFFVDMAEEEEEEVMKQQESRPMAVVPAVSAPIPTTKVQVKGLPWKSSQQEIVQHFSSFGPILSCKLPVQNDGQTSGMALLEFADLEAAAAAVATDGMDYFGEGTLSIKYGHSLAKEVPTVVRVNKPSPVFASSRAVAKAQVAASSEATKVMVRNLPWRTSQQEVIQYFSACGEIVSCKLMLEGDGRAKGEAVMEFAEAAAAAKAVDMNGSDYFGYGKLNIEYQAPKKTAAAASVSSKDRMPMNATQEMATPMEPAPTVRTKEPSGVAQNPTESTVPPSAEPQVAEAAKADSPKEKELAAAYDIVNQWDEIYKALEGDKQELVDLRNRLETLESENQELQKQLTSTSQVVSQWEEKYEKMTNLRDALTSRSESLEKENEDLRQELGTATNAASQSTEKSKELEVDRELLDSRLSSLEEENQRLLNLLTTANETASLLDTKYKAMEEKQQSAMERLELIEKEKLDLEKQIKSANEASAQSDEKYSSLEAEREDLTKRIDSLEKENAELKAANTANDAAEEDAAAQLKAMEYDLSKLKERNEALEKENADMKKELASAGEVASNEFQKSMGLEEARRKLQKRVEALEKETTQLKRDLSSAQTIVSQSDEDVKDLFEDRKKILARLDQQENENKDLQEKLALTNDAVTQWEKKYKALEKEAIQSRTTDAGGTSFSEKRKSTGPTIETKRPDEPQPITEEEFGSMSAADEEYMRKVNELNEEMESRIRYLEEKIAREEQRMQEMDAAMGSTPTQSGRAGSARLVVTGLDWKMPREEVYQLFSNFGDLVSCELPLHTDGRPIGKAIIEYVDEESAQRAIMMNGEIFGPGTLSIAYDTSQTGQSRPVNPGHRRDARGVGGYGYQGGPQSNSRGDMRVPPYKKILVRGLPWRAQQQDILDYFSTFGPINSCKLQVQGDGRTSGSATIEFGNAESAARAMQMNGREYYGDGRLNIQYLTPSGSPVDPKNIPGTDSLADTDSSWYT